MVHGKKLERRPRKMVVLAIVATQYQIRVRRVGISKPIIKEQNKQACEKQEERGNHEG